MQDHERNPQHASPSDAELASEVNGAQLDAVLRYLPLFKAPGFECGEWITKQGQMPFFSYSPIVDEFISTLYGQNIIVSFDWVSWGAEAERYRLNQNALDRADLLTVRKLLTAHVRIDRFNEGHLAEVFERGLLVAMLERLKQIRDEVRGGTYRS